MNKNKYSHLSNRQIEQIEQMRQRQYGQNNSNAKSIYCMKTGKIFPTVTYAAAMLNLSQSSLSNMLSGRRKNTTTLRYMNFFIEGATLAEIERAIIIGAINEHSTKKQAAKALGIGIATLHRKLKNYG